MILTRREMATKVAWHFLGTPYIWGGDDPSGFDCSGFVVEILKSAGILPRVGDLNAQGLYDRFLNCATIHPQEGCLVFWGEDADHVQHVEYCLDATFSIGASGGRKATTDEEIAWEQNAYIMVRPFRSRPNRIGFFDPFR